MEFKRVDPLEPPKDYADDEEDHPAIVWLREQYEAGNIKELEAVIEFWRYCKSLGRAGRVLLYIFKKTGQIIVWTSGVFGAWWVLSGDFSKWWHSR